MSAFTGSIGGPTGRPVGGVGYAGLRTPDIAGSAGGLGARQADFAEALSIADRARGNSGEPLDEAEARDAAERLVAVTLVQPLLAQARASYDPAPPFHQTPAERQFGSLQDARVALDVVRGSRWSIVDRLAEGLARPPGDGAAGTRNGGDS